MTEHVTNYSIKFQLKNKHLEGCLVGTDGKFLRQIKGSTRARIDVKDGWVTIEGEVSSVKKAEEHILNKINVNIFEIYLTKGQAGELIGINLSRLKQIQETSGASVSIANVHPQPSGIVKLLTIMGKPDQFKTAKRLIFDILENKIMKQLAFLHTENCFKECKLEKGIYKVKFIKNQVNPLPRLFYVEIECKSSEKEDFCPQPVDYLLNQIPSNITKKSGILAPHLNKLHRAEVIKLNRESEKLTLTVKLVDSGIIKEVDIFRCRDIERSHLYHPKAIPCKMTQVEAKGNGEGTVKAFQDIIKLNNSFRIKLLNNLVVPWTIVDVEVRDKDGNDVSQILFRRGVLKLKDDPLAVKQNEPKAKVGSVDLLFVAEACGGVVTVTAKLMPGTVGVTFSKPFGEQCDFEKSLKFCKTILKEKGNNALSYNGIHLTLGHTFITTLIGESLDAGVALCINSKVTKTAIPTDITITGTVTEDGKIGAVTKIPEKILAAIVNGKRKIFLPKSNLEIALSFNFDIDIVGISDMQQLLKELGFL